MKNCCLVGLALLVTLTGCSRRRAEPEKEPDPVAVVKTVEAPFLIGVSAATFAIPQGGNAKLQVTVTPRAYRGPVTLTVGNLPGTVKATSVHLQTGETSGIIELAASTEALPGAHGNIYLQGVGAGTAKAYSAPFSVSILKLPFVLSVEPAKIFVSQDGSAKVRVRANRQGYDGPIQLAWQGLPSGVKPGKSVTIPAKQQEAMIELHASSNAGEVANTSVSLTGSTTATPPMQASTTAALTVQGPPFRLQASTKSLTIPFSPGKAKLMVMVTRRDYQGPIALEFDNLPKMVSAGKVVIPEGKSEAEVEVTAPPQAPAGESGRVRVQGIALAEKHRQASSKPFTIAVEGPPFSVTLEPGELSLVQGTMAQWNIVVARRSYDGPIKLEFAHLPKDVKAGSGTLFRGQDKLKVDVSADDFAKLGESAGVQVVATALSLGDAKVLSRQHNIRVLEPYSLTIDPGAVQILEGAKAKVEVKAIRRAYDGPIALSWRNLPASVSVSQASLPAKENSVEVELSAAINAPASKLSNVHVEGLASTGRKAISPNITLAVGQRPFDLAVKPSFLTLVMGDKGIITVTAKRISYDGPIQVTVPNLPDDVKAAKGVIAAGKSQTQIEISVPLSAKPGAKAILQAVGVPATGKKAEVASNNFRLDVRAGLFDLAVAPEHVPIELGAKAAIKVSVARKGYKGPIAVDLTSLPRGMSAARAVIAAGDNQASIELKSDPAGKLGDFVDVVARGRATLLDKTVTSGRFTISVGSFGEEPAIALKPGAANVNLTAGGSVKMNVALARKSHDGPVDIEIRNLPKGVSSERVTIAEKQNSAVLTLTAAAGAEAGVYADVCLVGTAMIAGEPHPFASPHFTLTVDGK